MSAKILVVDDEESIRILFEKAMKMAGYDCMVSEDGEKALEKRYLIQDRMNQVLGRTALGHCDGGSIDTNSIEITNLVIDAKLAKTVIAAELADTDFKDYLKIYHTKTE